MPRYPLDFIDEKYQGDRFKVPFNNMDMNNYIIKRANYLDFIVMIGQIVIINIHINHCN